MFTPLAVPLNRQSTLIRLVLIASCAMTWLPSPSAATKLSWDGFYRDEYASHSSPIKAINLRQLSGNRFEAQIQYIQNYGEKTVRIVGLGSVYKNEDAHNIKDAMVIFCPTARFQPIVILKSGPVSKKPEHAVLHFDFLEYTLFENSEFRNGYAGKILRHSQRQE